MSLKTQASVDDLYLVPDNAKAELVDGEIIIMSPTGDMPSMAAFRVTVSLDLHAQRTGMGRAYPDNIAYIVDLPRRKSFSPDASYYVGPRAGMKFLQGAPVFAVEVRSEGDYGPRAEAALARKRTDYFAAGTLVVWDVDLLGDDVVRVYRAADPDTPTVYRRGEVAEAEPAVPGWTLRVDDLFA